MKRLIAFFLCFFLIGSAYAEEEEKKTITPWLYKKLTKIEQLISKKQYQKAASIKYLAYKKGFITSEKYFLQLANMFLYIGAPYKAAHLLQDGISHHIVNNSSKNWETLANAWHMAKEYGKSITALEMASKLNDKGRLYQRLGQIYIEQEKWKESIVSLNKAIEKGGLNNTGNTYLLLGLSYYELDDMIRAKRSFLSASQYAKNKKAALQWLDYINESKQ